MFKLKSTPSDLNKLQYSVSSTNSFCDFIINYWNITYFNFIYGLL